MLEFDPESCARHRGMRFQRLSLRLAAGKVLSGRKSSDGLPSTLMRPTRDSKQSSTLLP